MLVTRVNTLEEACAVKEYLNTNFQPMKFDYRSNCAPKYYALESKDYVSSTLQDILGTVVTSFLDGYRYGQANSKGKGSG